MADLRRRRSVASVVARFTAAFADIAIDVDWESDSLNAQAWRLDTGAHVRVYGGLARHRQVRWQGLALAIAHEIGHHKGGPPAHRWYPWLSSDARADAWAASVGLPEAFGPAAATVARRGAAQLFGALAAVSAHEPHGCRDDAPCLHCRARAFGAELAPGGVPGCARSVGRQLA